MTARPDDLTVRPNQRGGVEADPLAEALRSVRLSGGVFLDVRLTAPFSVLSGVTADDCRQLLPDPAQLIGYHVALEGQFLVSVEGVAPLTVQAGEIVLLPRNDHHIVASGPGLAAVSGASLIQPSPTGGLARIRHGGPGEATAMVCGFLGTQGAYNPLLAALPPMLKIDLRAAAARDWIEASVRFAAKELAEGRLASSSMMSRLSEVLLIEAVRSYAAESGPASGWLRGLGDPQIGRTLAMIHRDIAADWSADGLARAAGLSRSAFVERFSALVGLPPIRYVTMWRLETARLLLKETRQTIVQIAPQVGYDSEEAFSRAFKREFGESPRDWRHRNTRVAA